MQLCRVRGFRKFAEFWIELETTACETSDFGFRVRPHYTIVLKQPRSHYKSRYEQILICRDLCERVIDSSNH